MIWLLHAFEIVFPLGVVSEYMAKPSKKLWEVVKGVMRYQMAQRICVYAWESGRHLSMAFWVQTMFVMWIVESSLMGMCLPSQPILN